MRVLIVEDETYTAEHLKQLICKFDSTFEIIAILDTVKDSINWLRNNDLPDLIFQDIVLKDGNCFEIYDEIDINVPIIFTTAYSEYALQSFKLNSIDYIVKPYDYEDISKVLQKYQDIKSYFHTIESDLVREILLSKETLSRKRFLVKTGDKYYSIKSESVTCFYYDMGVTTGISKANKKFIIDVSINELNEQLDRQLFFQINRKYIVNIESIVKISKWFNNRLKIELNPPSEEELIVSRDRVKFFKDWLNQ